MSTRKKKKEGGVSAGEPNVREPLRHTPDNLASVVDQLERAHSRMDAVREFMEKEGVESLRIRSSKEGQRALNAVAAYVAAAEKALAEHRAP